MPNLSKITFRNSAMRDQKKMQKALSDAVKTVMEQEKGEACIVKVLDTSMTVTPLQPTGDKVRMVINFQVTPKTD